MDKKLQGAINKAAGATFEGRLSVACNFYRQQEVAHIEKTPEPFRITGRDKFGRVCGFYEKKGQPDFKGVLCDGRGIIFEAKHTSTDRIRQEVITEEQWKSLELYEVFKAYCFVMVSLNLKRFYRVPWRVWKEMKSLYGRKYMTEKELEPYELFEKAGVIGILEGLEVGGELEWDDV